MNGDQRERIRDTARYLRQVRPIDPEELTAYVEGKVSPEAIRTALRREALGLRLVERPDGTFVPVSEEPAEPEFGTVAALPERYEDRIETLLVDRHGPDWEHGETGDRLRRTIRLLKERYYRQHPVEYDADVALGYAIYHVPNYYAAVQYVLDELGSRRLLPSRIRIVDVGAGVGGPAIGIADYLPKDTLVEYHAIEPSESADIMDELLDEVPAPNFHAELHRTTAEAFDPHGSYDLVLFANVLSELDDPATVVERYLEHLDEDGAFVGMAPADRNTSIGLRSVEREIVDHGERYDVFAPTLRLWPGERPTDEGWSFDVRPSLSVPSIQRRLDEGRRSIEFERPPATGEFVNTSVRFSYSIVRSDGIRRSEFEPHPHRFARMSEMDRHVTDRIDCVGVKLSHSLSSDGKPVFKTGDGSESVSHYAVLVRETSLNRPLLEAGYGDVLRFEGVLVLWNSDEAAYNLIVDEETIVDRVG